MRALFFFILIFSGTVVYAQAPEPEWLIREAEELYAYEPGRDISEPIPVLIFEEREAKETKN